MQERSYMDKTIAYNPATGQKIGEFPLHTREQVLSMIEQAKEAQPLWRNVSVSERTRRVRRIRDYLVQNSDRIAAIISGDNGKTMVEALVTEVMAAAMCITYYCRMAEKFLKDKKYCPSTIVFSNKTSYLRREPFGVIGVISPWNYPFIIPLSDVIMALLAGNAVVLKTASETQATGHVLKEAIEYARLPDNIFQYVNIPGSVAGDCFIDGKIDKLFFTGSTTVGKRLMANASKHLIPVSLELGGNDPMIVCEDAPVDRAVNGALWAGFQNAGQSCAGVERIYVHESVYGEFVEKLSQKVSALKIGCGQDFSTQLGVMTTQKQKDTVMEHVRDALDKGATIAAEAKVPEELSRVSKTACNAYVLTNVNHDMTVMKEETFGPVVGIMPFRTYEEAIDLANDSHYGLSASVWSKDREKADRIATRIKAGAVTINDHLISFGMAETPWGGFKESGIGRTHGRLGFDEMTQPQIIVDDRMPFMKKSLWWHPYSRRLYRILLWATHLLYPKKSHKRLSFTRECDS